MNLISKSFAKLTALLSKGSERSVKAKKNIVLSFIVKGGNILIGFILFRLMKEYVTKSEFGVWLAIFQAIAFIRFFDVGLGNGLRNKLSEALADGNVQLGRMYVSTTYFVLAVIMGSLALILLACNHLIPWSKIMFLDAEQAALIGEDLQAVTLIVFGFFSLNFVLKLLHMIFMAKQEPAQVGLFNFVSQCIVLVCIGTLLMISNGTIPLFEWMGTDHIAIGSFELASTGNITNLAWVISGTPVLVLACLSLYFFWGPYKELRPSPSLVRLEYFKDLISLGAQFFVIQIIGLVLFQTDNWIILYLYGPSEVPAYMAAFKYFGIITQGFAILSTPFWSAYTEAYRKKDYDWIRKTMKKLKFVWYLMLGLAVFLLAASPWVYDLWLNDPSHPEDNIQIPFLLSACMALYVVVFAYGVPYVVFINGVGKVKLQMIVSSVGGILNIPLSIFLAETVGMGLAGIILSTTICVCYGYVIAPIQYRKIMNHTAKGIWNQ
ncbi:MATE family efflux transporter [Pontibacter sp. G13]|uniref:lipopolysaccharide biosynthesis protein n=1 Tax=Pontibacter sp. G13 TaxID=3074898 RepID=UPI00288A9192|nr:MATE family efflux transporter [Pontibacter sp. G13]WNJ19759.1 MATE family efflux transporter [Pontibacter sp. G13]